MVRVRSSAQLQRFQSQDQTAQESPLFPLRLRSPRRTRTASGRAGPTGTGLLRLASSPSTPPTLAKGSYFMVQGAVRTREFERDGIRQPITEVRAESVGKLDFAERAVDSGNNSALIPSAR